MHRKCSSYAHMGTTCCWIWTFWFPPLCLGNLSPGQGLLEQSEPLLCSAISIHQIPREVCPAILLGEVQVFILSIVWTNILFIVLLLGALWGVAFKAFLWHQQKNFLSNCTFRCSCFLCRNCFSWYSVSWKVVIESSRNPAWMGLKSLFLPCP